MRHWTLFSFLVCLLLGGHSLPLLSSLNLEQTFPDEKVYAAYVKADYKAAITILLELLQEATGEQRCALQQQLAKIYFKDQDREKAFHYFLLALDSAKEEPLPPITAEEHTLYEQALKIYLDYHSTEARKGAEKIIHDYGSVAQEHPNYYLLGYLLSAAYANLEQFEEFFDKFYQSYRFFPHHYMAYKIKTILHSQLFMRAQTPAGQEIHRCAILANAELAIQKNPFDTTLYKMLISFALDANKGQSIVTCLNKIIDKNIIIPRADIAFYVQQAVAYKQNELAQRFLNKERQWFPQSRVIDSAQRYLDSQ